MTKKENKNTNKSLKNRQLFAFCFFVLIALILWLMSKLSIEYSTTTEFTPQIINSLSGGTYINEQNTTLNIQIKARGFYILQQHLSKKHILEIDLKDKKINQGKQVSNQVKLPTANLKDKIADILGRDVTIISIDPDTLYLKYSNPISKKVPIVANLGLTFEKEYKQTLPIIYNPDSITITGQQDIISSIKEVYTEFASYSNLNENLETNLSLSPINNVIFSQRKVKITIPIERCTESAIKLQIEVQNTPKSSNILLLPSQVEVKYIVPVKDYPKIKAEDFYATVDFLDIDSLITNRKLKVNLTSKPKSIISFELTPEFVDFIQQKTK